MAREMLVRLAQQPVPLSLTEEVELLCLAASHGAASDMPAPSLACLANGLFQFFHVHSDIVEHCPRMVLAISVRKRSCPWRMTCYVR